MHSATGQDKEETRKRMLERKRCRNNAESTLSKGVAAGYTRTALDNLPMASRFSISS